jgi:RNA 2',3'-cyclic 3'-phosphodiesterase
MPAPPDPPSQPPSDPAASAPPKARLFIALDLPTPVVEALVAWRDAALDGRRGLRPVAPEALHVTLAFLGWREEAAIAPLGELVQACARPVGELALGAALWLPRSRPRVLAVALADPHGELLALQERLVGALVDRGWYEPEARPFLAHVTVARVRKDARVRAEPLAPPPTRTFAGAALTLYRSRLEPRGARYEPQSRVRLA